MVLESGPSRFFNFQFRLFIGLLYFGFTLPGTMKYNFALCRT
jgi:hypothetical protein